MKIRVSLLYFVSDAQERVLALSHCMNLLSVQFLLVDKSDLLGALALGRSWLLELDLLVEHSGFRHDRVDIDLHLGSVFLGRNAVKRLRHQHLGWSHLPRFEWSTLVCSYALTKDLSLLLGLALISVSSFARRDIK